ncbi:MAG: hypothetical protein ACR2PX_18345 [Endozoicomonas sp.]|uniref:hypothetical protein n=1 Tax=Endozoicomonas sp. TaxID=1892382 RepID=UPI003D9B1383
MDFYNVWLKNEYSENEIVNITARVLGIDMGKIFILAWENTEDILNRPKNSQVLIFYDIVPGEFNTFIDLRAESPLSDEDMCKAFAVITKAETVGEMGNEFQDPWMYTIYNEKGAVKNVDIDYEVFNYQGIKIKRDFPLDKEEFRKAYLKMQKGS